MELGPGNFRRHHIVGAVTLLAGNLRPSIRAARSNDLRMEPMLEGSALVTGPAVDGLDPLFVGNVLRVETYVTCNADKFSMR